MKIGHSNNIDCLILIYGVFKQNKKDNIATALTLDLAVHKAANETDNAGELLVDKQFLSICDEIAKGV